MIPYTNFGHFTYILIIFCFPIRLLLKLLYHVVSILILFPGFVYLKRHI